MKEIASAQAFAAAFDVSRETLARCETHLALLTKWTRSINLVSRSSLPNAWSRHFADSAQLWHLGPPDAGRWLDLGSGAGFPGLVIAALAAEKAPDVEVHLVESDQRKAAFLHAVVQAAGLAMTRVHACRVEELDPASADVVTARALAPLQSLLPMAEKHRRPAGIALFPKGATVHKEIAEASARWRFEWKIHPSLTEQEAAIVEIGAIHRV